MRHIFAGLALVLFSIMYVAAPVQRAPAPEHTVTTPGGQDLYEFESLIYHQFGPVVTQCLSAQGHPDQSPQPGVCQPDWFYRGYRSPAIDYSQFMYAFTDFGPSTFHLMPSGFGFSGGTFGNWPSPVTLNGRLVACNHASTYFLVSFGDVMGAGNWDCLNPGPGPVTYLSLDPGGHHRVSTGGQNLYEAEALIFHSFGGAQAWGHCYHLGSVDFGAKATCTFPGGQLPDDAAGWSFGYAFTDFGPAPSISCRPALKAIWVPPGTGRVVRQHSC